MTVTLENLKNCVKNMNPYNAPTSELKKPESALSGVLAAVFVIVCFLVILTQSYYHTMRIEELKRTLLYEIRNSELTDARVYLHLNSLIEANKNEEAKDFLFGSIRSNIEKIKECQYLQSCTEEDREYIERLNDGLDELRALIE